MEYHAPDSTCQLCGQEFSRKGMARHIRLCLKKELEKRQVIQSESLIHLHISAIYRSDYFLHLLISSQTTLKELDTYLRSKWLECCGHLSAFFVKNNREELKMSSRLGNLFSHIAELHYEYDFGSTTDLTIKLLDKYPGTPELAGKINLLSRNAMPVIPCDACGKSPAVQICTVCQWDGDGWLCEACAKKHDCEEEMFLPVVNSPRVGVCGYQGDFEEEDATPEIFTGAAPSQQTALRKQNLVLVSSTKKKTSELKQKRVSTLKELIRLFSKAHLNQELESYAIKLVNTLHHTEYIDITRGKIEIWASAVIYVIARLNFLFDPLHPNCLSADTICDFFKTKKSTVAAKATQIEEECDLEMGEKGYCSQEIVDELTFYETPQGFVFPKSLLPQMKELLANVDPDKIGPAILNILFKNLETMLSQTELEELKTASNSIIQDLMRHVPPTLKPKQIHTAQQTKLEVQKQIQLRLKLDDQQQKRIENEQEIINSGQFTIFDEN